MGYGMLPTKIVGRYGALPTECGNQVREYKAMHEESFPRSWLREDVEAEKAEMIEWKKEAVEEECKSGKREVEREEEKTVINIRCECVSSDVFLRNFIPIFLW